MHSHAKCQSCKMSVMQNVRRKVGTNGKCAPRERTAENVRHNKDPNGKCSPQQRSTWKMCATTEIPMEYVRHTTGPHGKCAPQQSSQWKMCVTTAIQREIFSSLIFQRNFSRLAGCPRSIGAFSMRSKADKFNFQNLYVSLF